MTEAGDSSSPESRQALGDLFSIYWYPLYAYVRRTGSSPDDAQDLTQSFFLYLMENNVFRVVDRKRGKFRWFLLATFKHFLANQRRNASAQKRGGKLTAISLDSLEAEERYRLEPSDPISADRLFDRQWALTVLEKVRSHLKSKAKDPDRFTIVEQYLPGGSAPPQAETAQTLGITLSALKVEIHRLKKRYAETLREEIARTVANEDEIDAEIRHLIDSIFQK